MELKDYYAPNTSWSTEYDAFTRKWRGYLDKDSQTIDPKEWNIFLSGVKDNPVASIGQGAFISKDGKEEPQKIKDNWSHISEKIKNIAPGTITLGKDLQEIKNFIVDKIGGANRNLAINRILITFFPNFLINIPNEDDVDNFIELLKPFGFGESTLNNWVEKSMRLKSFIYNNVKTDDEKYINCWAIYDKLRKLDTLKENYNLVLTGAPGTGKTWMACDLAASLIGCSRGSLKKEKKEQFCFVQFHPSYDYTDFVEGLRPDDKESKNEIKFKRIDGVFKDFCKKAALHENEEDKKYVFVIDEINRGEISKIFGELFFSIDPGYRKPEERIPVKTQYQNLVAENDPFYGGFFVPENLYIIGTMNDIDRSVESMDFAFRRRFAFKEITAEDSQQMLTGKNREAIIQKMDALNSEIEKELGLAYQIGAAYFKETDKLQRPCRKADWEELWNNHIYGVLFEYLRGHPKSQDLLKIWKEAYDGTLKNKNVKEKGADTAER